MFIFRYMKKLFLLLTFCTQVAMGQIDVKATAETKALFKHLLQLSKDHVLFGHQHATEYGHGWANEADRSDV
jgi:mannan endo-1,4-beta-mannosidase